MKKIISLFIIIVMISLSLVSAHWYDPLHLFHKENGILYSDKVKTGNIIFNEDNILKSNFKDGAYFNIKYSKELKSNKNNKKFTAENSDIKTDFYKLNKKILDTNSIRYINRSIVNSTEIMTSYSVFDYIDSVPTILSYIPDKGYFFVGTGNYYKDLKVKNNYSVIRYKTKDMSSCPVIVGNQNAIIIEFHKDGLTNNDVDKFYSAIERAVSDYGITKIKSSDFFMANHLIYYRDGLSIKQIGRLAKNGNTIMFFLYINGFDDSMFDDFTLLATTEQNFITNVGNLQDLNENIDFSIKDKIIQYYMEDSIYDYYLGDFTKEEEDIKSLLYKEMNKDEWLIDAEWGSPFIESGDDFYEYSVTLKKKPVSNIIEFDIETQGLNFYYQSALTDEEKNQGKYRPSNIINSYAVYYDRPNPYKVMHIYRPKIIDSDNNWIWADLFIDEENNKLRVTINQTFLDNAKYPVIVDPTLGYTSIGGSSDDHNLETSVRGIQISGVDGNVTNISAYVGRKDDLALQLSAAIYDNDTNELVGEISPKFDGNILEGQLITLNFTNDITLSSQNDYFIVFTGYCEGTCSGNTGSIYYDDSAGYTGVFDNSNGYVDGFPSTLNLTTTSETYTIYIDYYEISSLTVNSLSSNDEILNNLSTILNISTLGYNDTVWYSWNDGIINSTLCTIDTECLENETTITFPRYGYYNLSVWGNDSEDTIKQVDVLDLFVWNLTLYDYNDETHMQAINFSFGSNSNMTSSGELDNSDDVRVSSCYAEDAEGIHEFSVWIQENINNTKSINWTWEGFDDANIVSMYLYNDSSDNWISLGTTSVPISNDGNTIVKINKTGTSWNSPDGSGDLDLSLSDSMNDDGRIMMRIYAVKAIGACDYFDTDYVKLEVVNNLSNTAPIPTNILTNFTNFTTSTINITYNITDDNDYVINATLIIDGVINETITNPLLDVNTNISVDNVADGDYYYQIEVCDSDNSCVKTNNDTFTVDATSPVTTPDMKSPTNGASYTNDTWTKEDNITTTMIATDTGVGYDTLAFPVYCNDSSNTCQPDTYISSGVTIWDEGTSYIRFYSNDTLENQEDIQSLTLKIDTVSPDIEITTPINNTNTTNTLLSINYTYIDATSGVDSCWYSNDSFLVNTTLSSCGTNITSVTWSEGQHNITIWINDTANNINEINVVFTIDNILPDINITFPDNNSNQLDTSLSINYTYSDDNVDSCWYSNDSFSTNTTISCGTNITDISWSDAEHNVTIWINDSANNVNQSDVSFTIHSGIPDLEIITPTNHTNTTNTILSINYTYEDSFIDSCWYSNDSFLVNTTLSSCGTNITTETWSEGYHNVTIWANDTFGNTNQTEVVFTIDTTAPTVTIEYPTDYQSFNYKDDININFTRTDLLLSIDSCWWSNDSSVSNYTLTTPASENITVSESGDGGYNVSVWCNDSLNNIGTDIVFYTISLTAPAITIDEPTDESWKSNNLVKFNLTAIDSNGIGECQLWGNWTGVWHQNLTNDSLITSGLTYEFSQTIIDGYYKFGFWCNDTTNAGSWSPANFSFGIDTVNPLISYESETLSNETNTTNDNIYINISYTEINLDTITFLLYNSTDIVNETSYTTSTYDINWTGLIDETYSFNVTINDTTGASNTTDTYIVRLDDTAPDITAIEPLAKNYNTNDSMELNYTYSDNLIGIDECWYYVKNSSGSIIVSTVVLSNCENTTFTLPGGDIDYTLYLFAKDNLANSAGTTIDFGIRTESPAVSLSLTNDTNMNTLSGLIFNYSVSTNANNITNCSLYGDFDGTWALNQTTNNPSESTTLSFTGINFDERISIWNVECYDNFNTPGWALNNLTFVTDITVPLLGTHTITTSSGSQTFTFNTSVNDTNLDSCKYSVYDDDGDIDGINENVSFTCNSETSATATGFGTFNITVYGMDKGGNENSTDDTLTMSRIIEQSVGGGGTVTEIIVRGANASWSMFTDSRSNSYDFIMGGGGQRTKKVFFKNLEVEELEININCEDVSGELCQYVTIINKSVKLPPTENAQTYTTFILKLPEEVIEDTYDFNIVGVATIDESKGKLSVRAKVGAFGIFTWIINKIIGKTNFFGMKVFNFFFYILPIIILAPFLYGIAFSKITKSRAALTFLLTSIVIGIILFLLD